MRNWKKNQEKLIKIISGGFWLKIIIIFAVGFVFMQKDINFQVDLKSPLNNDVQQVEQRTKEAETSKVKDELSDSKVSGGLSSLASFAGAIFQSNHKNNWKKIDEDKVNAFVHRFVAVCQNEQKRFGINPSIILAVAIYQSEVATSQQSKSHHNFFNIPCQSGTADCYQYYESAWASFRGFSLYCQAHQLTNTSTDKIIKSLSKKLDIPVKEIQFIIEKYELEQFD